jgi:capsular exopolysaccharide synthesis family protein
LEANVPALVTLSEPRSPAAEAYRTLWNNIRFSSPDHPIRTLLVTSAGDDEGKSTTLCNLAVTIAQAGTRAIVVDCDLRRPSLHEILDLANDKGLTSALLDDGGADLPLQPTAVPGLQALTSGPLPPNPADLLGSKRLERVIEALTASADLVLFDSPPVSIVTDAAVLASRVDGVILVIGAGKTRREVAGRVKTILEKANARVLGVVLTNAQIDKNLYRYYANRGK